MRHPERDKIDMHYATPTSNKSTANGAKNTSFASPIYFKGILQTVGGGQTQSEYGNKLPYTHTLTCFPPEITVGCGIWIDAPITGLPDYEVTSMPKLIRDHRAELKKRGGFGG